MGRLGIVQHPGHGAVAHRHRFERAAGMFRKHLPDCIDEILLVADREEAVADLVVVGERIVDRVVGRALRPVEAELGRRSCG